MSNPIILRTVLSLLIWIGAVALQGLLMSIARFFERTSGQPTKYRLYLLPIALTSIACARYLLRIYSSNERWPDYVGDPIANTLFFIAGLLIFALGNRLHEKMMGGAAR